MTATVLLMVTFATSVLFLRGAAFHNHLIEQVTRSLRDASFTVTLECPCPLGNGQTDFIDILAVRDAVTLACEIETSPRYVAVNVEKAQHLGMPLFVVVPDRKTRLAVRRKLRRSRSTADNRPIWILLPDEVPQALANCFSGFSSANEARENGKTKKRTVQREET